MRLFTVIETPVGRLAALERDGALVYFGRPEMLSIKAAELVEAETPLFARLRAEMEEYFAGERIKFDLPLDPASGTDFQRKCREGMLNIPYGETRSYAWLASFAGSPKGARAAGGACRANPFLILVPCHRVVGADGSLTGFGAGLDAKKYLLRLEGRPF